MSETWNIPDAKLGVGAVVTKVDYVLLVQPNYGPAKGKWILPGGRVDKGETLEQGVQREVLEETGLKVIANGIVGFRQRLQLDGLVDVYFIWRCHLVAADIEKMPASSDLNEISAVRFWKIEEALSSPDVRANTRKCIELGLSTKSNFSPIPRPEGSPDTDNFFA